MPEMGRYCKAYLVRDLRQFPGWSPDLASLRPVTRVVDGREMTEARTQLEDDDILYLQENYTVTDGIFLDENVVFADVTDEWRVFCTETLDFRIPEEVEGDASAAESGAPVSEV